VVGDGYELAEDYFVRII